jgi:tetratricopeptide (TPR) repeat protein
MNPDDLDRLKPLPRRRLTVWHGGWIRFPMWIDNSNRPPFRPHVPVWLSEHDTRVHLHRPDVSLDSVSADDALKALVAFACDDDAARYLPGALEVNDADLAAYLESQLKELEITVRHKPAIEAIQEVEDRFAQSLGGPKVRTFLSGPGITDALLERFALAAAAFYQSAPWRYLGDQDYLVPEGLSHPSTMGCVVIMGAAKQTEGLSFFASPKDLMSLAHEASKAEKSLTAGSVTFDPLSALPLDDAARWVQAGWPATPNHLYPLCFFAQGGKPRGPTADELAHVIDWMEALAQTTETDIDSGRWEKTLGGSDRRMIIALPNLLRSATDPESRPRGALFDRRSMESFHAKIERYFQEHPPASTEEMNRILQEKFVGPIDDMPDVGPRTPAEQAQELCYQAFDAIGRRRVLLARQAIEIDPDCADAYNLLAEASYEPADALRFNEQALAAAERTLGSDFDQHVGHFWGVQATRPYMRARAGCAQLLDLLGRTDEAIAHVKEMLRLNPNDNQGIRYSLLAWLLKSNADAEAGKLLKQYDEKTAHWSYAKVLLAFRLSGKSTAAERELATAIKANRFVPERLLTDEDFQPIQSYSLGSPEEAEFAAEQLFPAFQSTPGALQWLADNHAQAARSAIIHDRAARRKQLERKKNESKKRSNRKRR